MLRLPSVEECSFFSLKIVTCKHKFILMTKVQFILKEINELNISEIKLVLRELLKKVDQERSIQSILNEYKGIGKGLWPTDAQDYINKEREQDRA
jgi:hypothetical protein